MVQYQLTFTPCSIGAVLPIWKVLADTVIPEEDKKSRADMDSANKKDHARVVRCTLDSGEPIVGLSLHHDDVGKVAVVVVFNILLAPMTLGPKLQQRASIFESIF